MTLWSQFQFTRSHGSVCMWHKKWQSALLSLNIVLAIGWCLMCLTGQLLEIGAPDGAIFLNFTIYHWSLPISATHFCLTSNIERGGTMYLYTVNICFRMNRCDFVLFKLMKAKPSRIHWALMGKPYNTFELYVEFQVLGLKSHKLKSNYLISIVRDRGPLLEV